MPFSCIYFGTTLQGTVGEVRSTSGSLGMIPAAEGTTLQDRGLVRLHPALAPDPTFRGLAAVDGLNDSHSP